MSRRTVFIIIAWLFVFSAALTLDRPTAQYFHDINAKAWLEKTHVAFALKLPGEYPFTILVAVVVGVRRRWRDAAFIAVAGLVSGVNGLIKWVAGRARPFRSLDVAGPAPLEPYHLLPMHGGIAGLIKAHDLCFPSGHAALAFATAEALAIKFPRFRWIFYGVASLTGIERFTETAHYCSDVVAAAALGVFGTRLAAVWWRRLDSSAAATTQGAASDRGFEPLQASIHE